MGASPWVILTHAGHVAVTEGFLSAAKRLGLPVVLLTAGQSVLRPTRIGPRPGHACSGLAPCARAGRARG